MYPSCVDATGSCQQCDNEVLMVWARTYHDLDVDAVGLPDVLKLFSVSGFHDIRSILFFFISLVTALESSLG